MFVLVSLLPLQCRLHVSRGFIVAVAVSPSHWSWFRCCHCSVAFVIALSQCHCRSVIVAVMSLWCLRCCIVMVLSSLSRCCLHCCLRCRIVAISSSPSWCHLHVCHGFVIAIMVSPSRRSWFHH